MNLKDIDFILSHLGKPYFPRKIMTHIYSGQFEVYSKEEIYNACKQAGFIDCRINAFSYRLEDTENLRREPNFVFIDLDLANFDHDRKQLDRVLKKTLNKLKDYESFPTVLWTGNGYHVYVPIRALILENYDYFSKEKFPNLFSSCSGIYRDSAISELFLTFAEGYLTGGKSDPQHKVRFRSSLLRFPDTFNSKCIVKGKSQHDSLVKIVQKWDGNHLPIQLLTKDFRRWITQREIDQLILVKKYRRTNYNYHDRSDGYKTPWIDKLLQKGIHDGIKETLRLILGPYLTKRKRGDDAIIILHEWLDKCDKVNPLDKDFHSDQRIRIALKNTYGYTKIENLRFKQSWLFNILIKELKL